MLICVLVKHGTERYLLHFNALDLKMEQSCINRSAASVRTMKSYCKFILTSSFLFLHFAFFVSFLSKSNSSCIYWSPKAQTRRNHVLFFTYIHWSSLLLEALWHYLFNVSSSILHSDHQSPNQIRSTLALTSPIIALLFFLKRNSCFTLRRTSLHSIRLNEKPCYFPTGR